MSRNPLYNSSNDPQRLPNDLNPEDDDLIDNPTSEDEPFQEGNVETESTRQTAEDQNEPTIQAEQDKPGPFDDEFDDLNIEDHEANFFARITTELIACANSEKSHSNRRLPTTWKAALSTKCQVYDRSRMTDTILQITTNLSNPTDILYTSNQLSPLAFLTIATGTFRKPEIVHNLYKEDDTETLGLIGLNRRAAIVEINVQQFFAQKNDTVPTMD
jgi:hypothetical protein